MTSPSLISQPVSQILPRKSSGLRDVGIPVLLFAVTMLSTTAVGMRYMHNFRLGLGPIVSDADILPYRWMFQHPHELASGLPFSLTLIAILLAHEFGHYFACQAFRVRSTLPYLLPAPSLSGTFGAVIRLKSRVLTRSALIVIGAAGPISGFAVAIAAVWVGLVRSTYAPAPVLGGVQPPLLISLLHRLVAHGGGVPPLALIVPHPMLFASWIGILITALNLIPAGQLDGGHILYALSPAAHRVATKLVIGLLMVFGIVFWGGWLLWGLLLLLPGMRHPKVPRDEVVTTGQYALIPVCVVMLALSVTLRPFQGFSLADLFLKVLHGW